MRTITVYSTKLIENGQPFDSDEFVEAYQALGECIRNRGGQLYLGQYAEAYLGDATFSHGWMFDGESFKRVHRPFKADVIFNKSSGQIFEPTTWVINHPELEALCLKHNTAEYFGEFTPWSFVIADQGTLTQQLEEVEDEVVVLKPLKGFGGKGVYIGSKKEIPYDTLKYPLLLQEFIDSSEGIPGLSDSIHDFRIIFFGGHIGDAYIRRPKDEAYISNVAQGGSIWQIPISSIPDDAIDLCMSVDKKLSGFTDRHYCIDIALNNKQEWKIIELNAPPGFPVKDDGPNVSIYMEQLADHLLKAERSPESVWPARSA